MRTPEAAQSPKQPKDAVDGDGQSALDATVAVAVRILPQDSGNHADSQNDESQTNKPFGPMVEALRQPNVQLKNGHTKGNHREGMAKSIGHPKPQSATPVSLHGCNV